MDTTPSTAIMAEARGWLADCDLPHRGTDVQVMARVARTYDGGWDGFVAASAELAAEADGGTTWRLAADGRTVAIIVGDDEDQVVADAMTIGRGIGRPVSIVSDAPRDRVRWSIDGR